MKGKRSKIDEEGQPHLIVQRIKDKRSGKLRYFITVPRKWADEIWNKVVKGAFVLEKGILKLVPVDIIPEDSAPKPKRVRKPKTDETPPTKEE